MSSVTHESTVTCPLCGHAKLEVMPTDACQFFYACEQCKALLRPKAGDCCVFFSFGSVKCPPVRCSGGAAAERQTDDGRLFALLGRARMCFHPAARIPFGEATMQDADVLEACQAQRHR